MSNDKNTYFPCFHILKEVVTDKDMPAEGRVFLGFIGFIGTIVYDPVDAVFTLFDLDRGNPVDPSDMNY